MTVARAARLLPDGDNVVSVDGGKLNERFDETSTLVRRTPTAARPAASRLSVGGNLIARRAASSLVASGRSACSPLRASSDGHVGSSLNLLVLPSRLFAVVRPIIRQFGIDVDA